MSKQSPKNSHEKWTEEEELKLKEAYRSGTKVKELAELHGRSRGAILSRLKKIGLIENESDKTEKPIFNRHYSREIIDYWRRFVADEERFGVSEKLLDSAFKVNSKYVKDGVLDCNKIHDLFFAADKKLQEKIQKQKKYGGSNRDENEEEVVQQIEVLIAPYIVKKNIVHGEVLEAKTSAKIASPCWIAAILKRDGQLIPHLDGILPWVDRRCLTPNENNLSFPILGDVSIVDEFYTRSNDPYNEENVSWNKIYSYAMELVRSLTKGEGERIFGECGYIIESESRIIPKDFQNGMSKNILRTYDLFLREEKKIPEIIKEMTSFDYVEKRESLSLEQRVIQSKYHYGQMNNQFSLSKSQRECLSDFTFDKNHKIVAVNGPPGTGKTTLIQSILATLFVESALKKSDHPPLVVASSTNNQAITNILDTFKNIVPTSDNKLDTRWLPQISSYGLYLAANTKEDSAIEQGHLYRLNTPGKGNVNNFFTDHFVESAKSYFIELSNNFFNVQENSLNEIQKIIHLKLIHISEWQNKIIDNAIAFRKMQEEMESKYRSVENLASIIRDLENEISEIRISCCEFQDIKKGWLEFWNKNLFWYRVFSWIFFIKQLIVEKSELYVYGKNYQFLYGVKYYDFLNLINSEINKREESTKQKNDVLEECVTFYQDYQKNSKSWQESCSEFNLSDELINLYDFESEDNILCLLDKELKYKMFYLAVHYWECQWLMKIDDFHKLGYTKKDRREYWAFHSMLTPCLVTTMHTGPGFFTSRVRSNEFELCLNFIDLLIVDEAGQVNPAVAGAMFSAAKKVCVVGDIFQIEPVVNTTESIDVGNFRKSLKWKNNIYEDELYDDAKRIGLTCVGGSIMKIAQHKSNILLPNQDLGGNFLLEHRRCVPEIISYCNELCYGGALISKRNSSDFFLPRMGYVHIKGQELIENNGSRKNVSEIEAMIIWLQKNQDQIVSYYNRIDSIKYKSLSDCVGIVTPFVGQSKEILSMFFRNKINVNKCGTVHTFQGAEMPIILFSSVYTYENKTNRYFFDCGPNMLNVAVSRAKDSFIVFGDMDILDSTNVKLPSGLLGKYLFANESNEIVTQLQPKYRILKEIEHITTLEQHRNVLIRSFDETRNELNIVSPFIRTRAIRDDGILDLVSNNCKRISINIYTDPALNGGEYTDDFNKAVLSLREVGANVYFVKNVHSKILTIDETSIIEGSFNWLSASRNSEKYTREESSIMYNGRDVHKFISDSMKSIRSRVFKVS